MARQKRDRKETKSMTTIAFTVMWVAVSVIYFIAGRDYMTD